LKGLKDKERLVSICILVVLSVAVLILGNHYSMYLENKGNIQTGEDGINKSMHDTKELSDIDKQMKDVIYDTISIIDSARTQEELESYPLRRLVKEVEHTSNSEDDKYADTTSDTKADTELDTREDSSSVIHPVVADDTVLDFLKLSKTKKEHYDDFTIAFYKDSNYIVGIVKPSQPRLDAVNKSIQKFMDKNFEKYSLNEHNGHLIIVSTDRTDELMVGILSNIEVIDTILRDAIEAGINAEHNPEYNDVGNNDAGNNDAIDAMRQ